VASPHTVCKQPWGTYKQQQDDLGTCEPAADSPAGGSEMEVKPLPLAVGHAPSPLFHPTSLYSPSPHTQESHWVSSCHHYFLMMLLAQNRMNFPRLLHRFGLHQNWFPYPHLLYFFVGKFTLPPPCTLPPPKAGLHRLPQTHGADKEYLSLCGTGKMVWSWGGHQRLLSYVLSMLCDVRNVIFPFGVQLSLLKWSDWSHAIP
jgi:hypothetical protein